MSIEYVQRIPTGPFDPSIANAILDTDLLDLSPSTCVVRVRQDKMFYSLRLLNRVLSSPTRGQRLQIQLAVQTDDKGDRDIRLSLVDHDGNRVALSRYEYAGRDPLQVVSHQGSMNLVGRSVEVAPVRTEPSMAIRTSRQQQVSPTVQRLKRKKEKQTSVPQRRQDAGSPKGAKTLNAPSSRPADAASGQIRKPSLLTVSGDQGTRNTAPIPSPAAASSNQRRSITFLEQLQLPRLPSCCRTWRVEFCSL